MNFQILDVFKLENDLAAKEDGVAKGINRNDLILGAIQAQLPVRNTDRTVLRTDHCSSIWT